MSGEQEEDSGAPAERWDAYLTALDGAPASVLVNLRWLEGPPVGYGWLHQWSLPMHDPGRLGLGSIDECEGFEAVESALSERLPGRFLPVGRERCAGRWTLSYYSDRPREDELRAHLEAVFGDVVARVSTGLREDEGWAYYREVLSPDLQQRRWMVDRDKVLALQARGHEGAPEAVTHGLYFEHREHAEAFIAGAQPEGFRCELAAGQAPNLQWPFMVWATRVEAIELGELHVAVMRLHELAAAHEGTYDDWELEANAPVASS